MCGTVDVRKVHKKKFQNNRKRPSAPSKDFEIRYAVTFWKYSFLATLKFVNNSFRFFHDRMDLKSEKAVDFSVAVKFLSYFLDMDVKFDIDQI